MGHRREGGRRLDCELGLVNHEHPRDRLGGGQSQGQQDPGESKHDGRCDAEEEQVWSEGILETPATERFRETLIEALNALEVAPHEVECY